MPKKRYDMEEQNRKFLAKVSKKKAAKTNMGYGDFKRLRTKKKSDVVKRLIEQKKYYKRFNLRRAKGKR